MCEALEVPVSGYYAWAARADGPTAEWRAELVAAIEEIHADVKGRYGSPRMTAELKARGHECSENTVAELMRRHGIRARAPRRFVRTTDSNHRLPVAANVLDREFDPDGPNQKWCADITYIPTREGWVYLAVVEDLFSRMVVGWSMGETMESRLVVDALEMAIARRRPGAGLLAHSDRGSQYASEHYQRALAGGGDRVQHERRRPVLGQRADGVVLRPDEVRDRIGPDVRDPRPGAGGAVRVPGGVPQPRPLALLPGVLIPG
jgi:transposase InsO family protein